jgi:hypothetical protein
LSGFIANDLSAFSVLHGSPIIEQEVSGGRSLSSIALIVGLSCCQKKEGPAERAGKQLDKVVEKAGQQIEKTGEKIEDAAKDANKK